MAIIMAKLACSVYLYICLLIGFSSFFFFFFFVYHQGSWAHLARKSRDSNKKTDRVIES